MKIMLTGGTGLLGKELIHQTALIVHAPTRQEFDILDHKQIADYLGPCGCDVLIHAAALTEHNRCEQNQELAYHTNCLATMNLSRLCKHYGIPMIYISTDYVFDGLKHGGMYEEDEVPNPHSFYAKTKFWGEIAALMCDHRIIRTSFCDGTKWPYDCAFIDKFSSRDVATIIAHLIWKCIGRMDDWSSIMHIGTRRKSFYELAKSISEDVKPNSINDVDFFVGPDTSLNTTKMDKLLGRK